MPLWTSQKPPTFAPQSVRTEEGWKDPVTKEVYVAFRNLSEIGGDADITKISFAAPTYVGGQALSVTVDFNEKVDVTAGATIVVTSTATGGNITLRAAGQTKVGSVVFDKAANLTDPVLLPASVAATGTLTLSGNATNGQTVTIGSKVYTFQTTLTDVDGNVQIGGDAEESIDNLVAAITLGAGAGTAYAEAMTEHPDVTAVKATASTITVTAKVAGTAGNSIATTETLGSGSFGAATLENGASNGGTISIGAQTLGGTIIDNGSALKAKGTLTVSGAISNNETVTLGSKTYTFQTTLTNSDGNVQIGATPAATLSNLVAAINLTAGAGVAYAAATTAHSTISARVTSDTTVEVEAKSAGTAGNSLASTETMVNGAFGGATLSGGTAGVASNKVVSAGVASGAGTRVFV